MFGAVATLPSFACESNPTYISLNTSSGSSIGPDDVIRSLLVHSGQPLDDMFKYIPSRPSTRLDLLEATLRWRHLAPTAPDTLWCHPYFTSDPFIIQNTPDIYIVGGQPKFATRLVVEENGESGRQKRCRVVLVPRFSETGVLVLVNLRTLKVKTVKFHLEGMAGGAEAH